jgi:glycosyltransferase involved in cell wall biosynthesis
MVAEQLDIADQLVFSRDRLEFEKMNILYNISDICINCSYAEGFGLSTLEAMQTGTPVVAVKTGGLTRQVVDHRDGTENGVAVDVDIQTLVGSQQVPYIYEDYASSKSLANAYMKIYEMNEKERKKLSKKVREYVNSEFSIDKTIDLWHESLSDCVDNWKDRYQAYDCTTF